MQHFLQLIAVDIPHAVEITGGKPVGVEDLFGFRTTDALEQQTFELIVREAVLRTRTDVIIVIPECFRYFGTAYALQEPTAVFHCSPFQHAADRYVEHDRVVVLQYGRIENSRLTKGCPLLDARVGDDPLRERFGDAVVVIRRAEGSNHR